MFSCPREEVSAKDRRALERLAQDHPQLRVTAAYRSGYDGTICGVYHDDLPQRELIGNRSVAQVRDMVDAIAGAAAKQRPATFTPIPQ